MIDRMHVGADPDESGDLIDPWDEWLAGDISFADLPAEDQERARRTGLA
jgi:hypothetical protein